MRLMFLFVCFSLSALQAQNIQWMTLAEAREAQKKVPKKNLYGCLHGLVWPL